MVLMYLIRAIVWIYNVLTMPIFLLFDRPFSRWIHMHRVQSYRVAPNKWLSHPDSTADPFRRFQTAAEFLESVGPRFGDKPCMGHRKVLEIEKPAAVGTNGKTAGLTKKRLADEFTWLSYREVDLKVRNIMRGLAEQGIRPRDKVLLALETRAEWLVSAMALMRMGVTVCTVYSTLGANGIVHAINELECSHFICNQKICHSILSISNQVPALRKVIVVEDQLQPLILPKSRSDVQVLTLDQVENSAPLTHPKSKNPDIITGLNGKQCMSQSGNGHSANGTTSAHWLSGEDNNNLGGHEVQADDLAIIMYTSGTTGVPKGVMFTQKSLLHALTIVHSLCNASSGFRVKLSYDTSDLTTVCHYAYLPSAHIFELCMEMFMISLGASIGFGSPFTAFPTSDGLMAGTRGDAETLNPTFTIAVPLVCERIKGSICDQVSKKPALVQQLFHFGIAYKNFWNGFGFSTPITDKLLFSKTRLVFGNRLQSLVVGGAAVSESTHQFLRSALSTYVHQGYGTTETFAMTCVQVYHARNSDCGQLHSRCNMMIEDWDEGGYRSSDKPNPRGELLVGGRHISAGYFKRDKETKESFFDDKLVPGIRWFRTGDIVEIDRKTGTIKIVDRKKDLVKLMNGEFVALGQLESVLKNCPLVSNLLVHGQSSHKNTIVIAVPDSAAISKHIAKMRPESEVPSDVSALCKDPLVIEIVEQNMRLVAKNFCLSRAETPAKVVLVPDQWTPENGLATASLKNRRKPLVHKYADVIRQAYESID